jgi:hypothetical protein
MVEIPLYAINREPFETKIGLGQSPAIIIIIIIKMVVPSARSTLPLVRRST